MSREPKRQAPPTGFAGPRWALALAVAGVALERLQESGPLGTFLKIAPLVAVVLGALFAPAARGEQRRVGVGFFVAAASALSYVHAGTSAGSALSMALSWLLQMVLFVAAIRLWSRFDLDRELCKGTVLAGSILAGGVFWSYLNGITYARYLYPGQFVDFYAKAEHRYSFPGQDANFTAFVVCVAVFGAMWLRHLSGRRVEQHLYLLLSAALFGAVLLTGSRGVLVALVLAAAVSLGLRSRQSAVRVKRALAVPVGATALWIVNRAGDLPVVSRTSDGLGSRTRVILESFATWTNSPLLGIGRADLLAKNVGVEGVLRVHGTPFAILLERGVLGALLLGLLLVPDLRRVHAKRYLVSRHYALGVLAVLAGLTINVEDTNLAWLLVGACVGAAQRTWRLGEAPLHDPDEPDLEPRPVVGLNVHRRPQWVSRG